MTKQIAKPRNTININHTKKVIDSFFAERKEKDKKVTFTKSKNASIGQEVFVVVKTLGLKGEEIEIRINQAKEKVLEEKNKALKITHNNKETSVVKVKVGNYLNDDKISNKDDFKDWAIVKVILSPSTEETQKKYLKAIKKTIDKKTFLSLEIYACTPNGNDVVYLNENGEIDSSTTPNYYMFEKGKWLELKRKIPVIVLDPGHGIKGGNVGAQARKYKYKVKADDGKVKIDKDKKEITELKDIMSLPQYVIDDPEKWIVGDNESKGHKYDNARTEYKLTFDIASKMKELLISKGYKNVFLTRKTEEIIDVTGNKLAYRIDFANNKKADYFISIHADGAKGFVSGAHSIHSSTDNIEKSKKVSEDIMKHYNVIEVDNSSPKKDVRGLRVLRTTNKTKRKTLIELGFLTSPSDAKKMFSNVNLMAAQLVKGLEENIEANF